MPTITSPAVTMAGVILGTVAYMPPEQAKGKPVDKRADMWAFGCVLFEMLTGRRAFEGETLSDVLMKVAEHEPDWNALPAKTPAPIRTLLRRCLEKDLRRRLDSAAVARIEIDDALRTSAGDASAVSALNAGASRARWRRVRPSVAAAILSAVAGVLATWVVMRPALPSSTPLTRLAIVLPVGQALALSSGDRDLVLSADGTRLVYSAGPQAQLMVRALDRLDALPLAGIENARGPFLSPNGLWVGFFERGDLKKVLITGGQPITPCRVTQGSRGASWGSDDIVFATNDKASGVLRVPANGGAPTVLTTADPAKGERDHYYPSMLPGGRGVLFTIAAVGSFQVAVVDLKTNQRKILIENGSQAEYVETGHVIYVTGGTLWAARFDLAKLEVLGDPVPVLGPFRAQSTANFTVSRQGTLVYVPVPSGVARSLVWVSGQGTEETIPAVARAYQYPRLSRDGTRLAVRIADQDNVDIHTWDLARHMWARLTFDPAVETYPIWTPDGQRIVFTSTRAGAPNLYWPAADGTGSDQRLTTSPHQQNPTAVSPNGRLVFQELRPDTRFDLMLLSLDGTSQPEPLIQTAFDESNAEISPDGHWLAYESNQYGQDQVFVRPFPNVRDGLHQISTGGGRTPVWAPNGRELFFVDGTSLMSVPVQSSPTFSWGNATKRFEGRSILFDARSADGGTGRNYDVSRDAQRFLVIKDGPASTDDDTTPAGMVVVQNWFQELKAKVPTGK